jgi:hypothetical protein
LHGQAAHWTGQSTLPTHRTPSSLLPPLPPPPPDALLPPFSINLFLSIPSHTLGASFTVISQLKADLLEISVLLARHEAQHTIKQNGQTAVCRKHLATLTGWQFIFCGEDERENTKWRFSRLGVISDPNNWKLAPPS